MSANSKNLNAVVSQNEGRFQYDLDQSKTYYGS